LGDPGWSIWKWIALLFFFGVVGTLYIAWAGMVNAYNILSGLEALDKFSARAKQTIIYAIVWPMFALLLQLLIEYLGAGYNRILQWWYE